MSGMAGLSRMREVPRIRGASFVCAEGERARRPRLDSSWTPECGGWGREVCRSLRNLVGPPGFEPGTSCTPNRTAEMRQLNYFRWLTVQ